MFRRNFLRHRAAFVLGVAVSLFSVPASAGPTLTVDLSTGQVLHAEEATRPWYPASLTKLMTAYVALDAVRNGKITLQTPLRVSKRANRMAPSKMGFRPGIEVTLENALKIIMVKSANDVSVTIAEGISGSVEGFAAQMNATARALGMYESHFVNPNGLHNPAHVSSARDMAILARALYTHFPNQQNLYGIGAIQLGRRVMRNTNGIIGRYPGANGMKTGYVCASGYNVVASATRYGRTLIVVVMGAPSGTVRTHQAMAMFDRGFGGSSYGSGQLQGLPRSGYSTPPNMRGEVCNGKRRRELIQHYVQSAVPRVAASSSSFRAYAGSQDNDNPAAFFSADKRGSFNNADEDETPITGLQLPARVLEAPIPVYVGRAPGWSGRVAGPSDDAAPAVENDKKGKPDKRTAARGTADTAGEPISLRGARNLDKPSKRKAVRTSARGKAATARNARGKASARKATKARTVKAKPAKTKKVRKVSSKAKRR